jgi:hypothetical protein
VFVTDPKCGPSAVRRVDASVDASVAAVAAAVATSGGSNATFVLGLWEEVPSALILWETDTQAFTQATSNSEPVNLGISSYLRLGFTLIGDLEQLVSLSSALSGWNLEVDVPQVMVRDPLGDTALVADTDGAPDGWADVVLAQGAAVAIVGSGLGLKAFSWERLEKAARRGQLAAAVIHLDEDARADRACRAGRQRGFRRRRREPL